MGKLSEIELELISAYLDGALDGSERQHAEQLLASNADAAQWFNQLTKMRRSLKELDSPKKLSGLADRVIAQARATAAQQGLPATHHVLADSPKVAPRRTEKSDSTREQRGGMWLVLGTLAASLLALAIIPSRPTSTPNGLASFPAQIEPSPLEPSPLEPSNLPTGASTSDPKVIVDLGSRAPSELHGPETPIAINLLNVLDIQMSPEAWQAGKFDQLLSQLGIVGADDFVAPKEALRILIENNVPGDIDADSREQLAMMYVHCTLSAYEKLDTQLSTDKASFITVKRMMANIGPDGSDKLMQAMELKSRSGASRNYSRLIMLDGQDPLTSIVPKFEAVKPDNVQVEPTQLNDINLRDLQAAAAFGNSGDKDETDAIVIIRKL